MTPIRTSTLVRMAFVLAACASSALAQDATARHGWFAYGQGIGNGGFHVSTANGETEIVVPCGTLGYVSGSRLWILVRHDPSTNTYEQVFLSPLYDPADMIRRIVIADVDPAPGPEIVVATRFGTIEFWNQASRTMVGSLEANTIDLQSIAVADLDGDGQHEVVVCQSFSLAAHELDGTVMWTLPTVGGYDVVVGQMDADPALEIATADGTVVDCGTEQVQWQWGSGFGRDLECADIDGDGYDEVVFAQNTAWAWAFDIDVELPKWSLPFGGMDCIRLAEVDGDAALELLIGENQGGDVLAYDTVTLQLDRTYSSAESSTTSIAVGDVDGDGAAEVIWGVGFNSTGPDHWLIADCATEQVEWQSPSVERGFVGPVRGDVDGDGQDEYVCAAPNLDWPVMPRILVFDVQTLDLEYVSGSLPGSWSHSAVADLALADADGDGDLEIFLADNLVTAFDLTASGLSMLWQANTTVPLAQGSLRSVAVADLDGDGTLEVMAGSRQFVHAFEYGAAAESWHSFYVGGRVTDIVLADSDLSGTLAVHALSSDGNLYVFDGATYSPRTVVQHGGTKRTAVHVLEGLPALILGDELGHMYLYLAGATGFAGIGPLPVATGPIDSLGYYPQLGLLHVSSGNRVALQYGLTPAWQTADYGSGYTSMPSVFGRDVLLDFGSARVASCGYSGFAVFDL